MTTGPFLSVEQLEDQLSMPSLEVMETLRRLDGDLIFLGVGGKMGPTLARMARRASEEAGAARRIYGVSRFSNPALAPALEQAGVEPIRCDLLDRSQLESLPDASLVIYMAARKFGSSGDEPRTWAMNSLLPGMVCERYRGSRIVAFSTGNVYPFTAFESRGAAEDVPPDPVGEYAMSCLGRERIFQYFSERDRTPVAVLRLNYAQETRYGVLVDLAQKIDRGEPIDVSMGYFNAIWQGEANRMALQALEDAGSPAAFFNIAGLETLRVRDAAAQLGAALGKEPRLIGSESSTALLSDGRRAAEQFGPPQFSPEQMIDWIADWTRRQLPRLDKPTHFEVRDGRF